MNLHKIWLIARYEYIHNFRRRTFLFTAVGVPLFTIVIMLVVFGLVQQSLTDTSNYKHIGIVDKAGVLVDSAGKPLVKLPEPFEMVTSPEAAAAVASKSLDGYYIIPADFMSSGHIEAYNRATLGLSEGLQNSLDQTIKDALSTRLGDPVLANRLQAPLEKLSIFRIGSTEKLESSALFAAFIVPFILGILIFTAANTTSQFLMSGLVEEKENRMVEVFITSVRPTEILWGKILGLGTLGLTQVLIWSVIVLIFGGLRGGFNVGQILSSLQLTPGYLLLLLAFFLLGYLVNSAIMFGVGASVNAEQESRQLGSFLSIISLLPFILSFSFIIDPNGTLPVFLSLFPLTAPVGMVFRLSWANVPPSQIALSLFLLIVSFAALIWLAARIFRLGMLNYGKRLSLRDIARSLRAGRQVIVIPNHEVAP
ncbi:MAG: ABC transporter permease [Chloroflexota bacterium]